MGVVTGPVSGSVPSVSDDVCLDRAGPVPILNSLQLRASEVEEVLL